MSFFGLTASIKDGVKVDSRPEFRAVASESAKAESIKDFASQGTAEGVAPVSVARLTK